MLAVYGTAGLTGRERAYDLLELAVREHWGLPALPEIARREGGKPWFPGHPDRAFNLSHSGRLALCALDSAPVGVDVQVVKRWREGLPARVCAPAELAWLEAQPDRWAAFTALWVLKESRAKWDGRGLARPIRSIPVPLPREGPGLYEGEGLYFRLYAGGGWAGAVCGSHIPPPKILWRPLP